MAAYTWTKEKCVKCGNVTRTRGLHISDLLTSTCFYCKGRMRWIEVHYGKEKYAGENTGKTIKRALPTE